MSVDHGLVIVPAGAGAGKTHHIQSQLSDWVKRGVVRPDRILAVTFTETAAGELRERIRDGLLADGLVKEAMAVERAYVSTIHGLGLRLLTEHAFAAGSSPQPRHIGDEEKDLLIRQALAHVKSLDPIKAEPARFGYTENFQQGTSVEDSLRSDLLKMIDLLRGLGDQGRSAGLIAPALQRLKKIYGKTVDADAAKADLLDAVQAMLKTFPEGGMAEVKAKGPRDTLEAQHALFQRVQRDPSLLDWDWTSWQRLRNLFTSNRNSKTPDGYDDLAQGIVEAAGALPQHPGPLADAQLHFSCLVTSAQEVMEAYEQRKRAMGLIDYADMISDAERLLRTDESVRQAVLAEIDCVIIDEFQDTNPVQFALLWQLGARAERTLLVGDIKQSIMGFQGADPRLSDALAAQHADATQPLDRNWRSTPAVMEFVNAMGASLFGDGYHQLTPTRDVVDGPALELLRVSKGRGVRNYATPPQHIADRIAKILRDQEEVTDRYSKAKRPVRLSDIAILVCRHTTAGRYAQELRDRGVAVRISENGWADSALVQAARAALMYAANPMDMHAALTLRLLGPDPLPPEIGFHLQMQGTLAEDDTLSQLAALSDAIMVMPARQALQHICDAAGLWDWADRQDNGAQARADLLRLEAEAAEFDSAHRDLKAASGLYGETVKVFLAWLDARLEERGADQRPDPSAGSAEAVEVVTWHASKGREWPITVVCEFDHHIEEWPGTTSTHFDRLDDIHDMGVVMASAQLLFTPKFTAPESQKLFIEDRRESFEANARNLLYVALTRARDRLILEWPDFLKARDPEEPSAKCLFHVLDDHAEMQVAGGHLEIGGVSCAATIIQCPEDTAFIEVESEQAENVLRFGRVNPAKLEALTPWRIQPSAVRSLGEAPPVRSIPLGEPWLPDVNDADRGTALHLALHCYLVRPDLTGHLPASTGLDDATLAMIAERAEALKIWLRDQGYSKFYCEIPVKGHNVEGSEIHGTIDLLAVGEQGTLLIDHKSGGAGDGLGAYWGQLSTYAALAQDMRSDWKINGVGIFWLDHGRLEMSTSFERGRIVEPFDS